KMEREILKIAEKKENIVIESHYAHDMPCDAIVVLRVQPKELLARGRKKGWPRAKIKENMEAEIMEVCKSEALESGKTVIEIDTTGKRPAEAAGEIVKRLNLRRA
ncbi:MAG: AAA family ATPase, partial [Candidatus Aenigmarchaeota archaeon]|nr:AAA family ATPase [Candidatus Aenigmarchaeota archaeon]